MATLHMGTCSWKYDSWRGIIYSDQKPINYLEEYAAHYSSVEIDQWFWSLFGVDKVALPSPSTVNEYRDSVPENFKFTVKVPNSVTLTHFYKKTKTDPLVPNPHFLSVELMTDFLGTMTPLKKQLGPLMFQFEYLNKQKMSGIPEFMNRVGNFIRQLDGSYSYAVEIRNPNYLGENYFRFLKEFNLGHVFLQGYYMPPITEIYRKFYLHITNTTVIRLHGPDRSDIEKLSGGNWNRIVVPRDQELEDIARVIQELLDRKVDVYVNMNNHYEGSAPLSIRRLEKFLSAVK